MKKLLIIVTFLMIGCSAGTQQKKAEATKERAVINNGFLISFDGINLSKYKLNVENFDVNQLTLGHLLCLATEECDENLFRKLVDKGADVSFKCRGEDEVITGVAFCEYSSMVMAKLLLDNGASINGADLDNDSVLSYAIGFDNLKLVKYLLENGADKNQRDTNEYLGCLPFHGVKSLKMLKYLLANGFEVSAPCRNGSTLLHFAAKENLVDVARYILDQNLVNPDQKDKKNNTALDYAQLSESREIVELLEKHQ